MAERSGSNNPPMRGPGRGFGGPRSVMPVVKAKDFKGTVRRLWSYFGKEGKLLSLAFLFVIGSAAVALATPYLIGRAIDAMSGGKGLVAFGPLRGIALILIAIYIADACCSVLQGWLMAGISQRIVQNLRRTVFAKLQKLTVSFFDMRSHGDLMSRLANDIENISSTISQATIQLLSSIITVTGSLVMMLVLSPLLALASLITLPMVFLLTKFVAKRTKVLFKEQQVILGQLNGHIEETISGLPVIKSFNHEEQVIGSFEEINAKLSRVGARAQIWSGFMMPLMNVINNIGFTAVAAIGGVLAVENMITVGIIASFLSYSRQFARPLNEIANIFNVLQSAVAGAERVFEILDEQEEDPDISLAIELKSSKGYVKFEEVGFGYREDVAVLKNVSFEAAAGSTVALVGPTGAGKTTIVNLLARFYDVTSGSIKIDGRDIRSYSRDSLRKCFGIVLQDTYLFSGTIGDNIRYGKLEATQKEVEAAAAMANAHVFINRLPKGYDTLLTESGSNLSQGQRQLLAIARAILADPSILILDEATSSVDTRTELHIQEAMLKLMKNRTSFIIAHRLSTIRDADIIMVIDNGQIAEKGSHEELLKSGGVYAGMYYSQLHHIAT
jgi:ATP-binding cassette subfamily B multidrug efflux pump